VDLTASPGGAIFLTAQILCDDRRVAMVRNGGADLIGGTVGDSAFEGAKMGMRGY
jgi:hypothetical protein